MEVRGRISKRQAEEERGQRGGEIMETKVGTCKTLLMYRDLSNHLSFNSS